VDNPSLCDPTSVLSRESVDVVRECFQAYLRGDAESALGAFDLNVQFDMTIRPDGQIYHGPQGVSKAMREWAGAFQQLTLEADEFLDAGDHVLIFGQQIGRARDGLEVKRPFFHLVTVHNGRIVHWKAYVDLDQALDAAGLDSTRKPKQRP
jgi:ketosteroid isomerase-like protein